MKFVPLSERNWRTGPPMAMNLLRALIKASLLISPTSSMCMALDTRQVKRMAQYLDVVLTPLVFFYTTTGQGPNASTPTKLKGGPGSILSNGRSAIFVHPRFPRSFLHIMHDLIREFTSRRNPTIQKPAHLTAPSVTCLPW